MNFTTWQKTARHNIHVRQIGEKAVRRVTLRYLNKAFGALVNYYKRKKKDRGIIAKVLKQQLLHAVQSWRKTVKHQRHIRQISTKAMLRIMNQLLAVAFDGWGDWTRKMMRLQDLFVKWDARMLESAFGSL